MPDECAGNGQQGVEVSVGTKASEYNIHLTVKVGDENSNQATRQNPFRYSIRDSALGPFRRRVGPRPLSFAVFHSVSHLTWIFLFDNLLVAGANRVFAAFFT